MQGRFIGLTIAVSAFVAVTASQAQAATYQVGAGKIASFAQLPPLQPGDVVEVAGGASYGPLLLNKDGTAAQKITVRGVRVDGKRPVLNGGVNTLDIGGSHVVIEGFDITGGTSRCVFHRANDVVIRDTVIHDCPAHGLLGADNGSGSLLMEYVEVHHTGLGDQKHQIYMATDEIMYPGSVFRMQFCYLHDGNGGHGVKSRAERNEIYYNWIEGSYYHELELIGPDPSGDVPEDKAREDSDVVGNVLRKTGLRPGGHVVRLGGDATGQSIGRYRFVNNTIIMGQGTGAALRIFDRVDTLEAHNNVFFKVGGGAVEAIRTTEAATPLPLIAGTNNWLPMGSKPPAEWTGTLMGTDPAFAAVSTKDLRPVTASPLVDKGAAGIRGIEARLFPSPLAAPQYEPPPGVAIAVGTAVARPSSGAIDIGAYELGGGLPVTPPQPTPPGGTTPPAPPPPPPAPPSTGTPPTTPPTTTPPAVTPPTTTPPAVTPPTTPPTTTPPAVTPPTTGGPSTSGPITMPMNGVTTPPAPSGNGGPIPAVTGDPPAAGGDKVTASGGCSVGAGGQSQGAWILGVALAALLLRHNRPRLALALRRRR